MNGQRSVLIVDQSEETREVLQTALERRGVRTLATGRAEKGLELARRHQPDLVVLDLEIDDMPADGFSACGAGGCGAGVPPADSRAGGTSAPPYEPQLILLGSLRRQGNHLPGGEFVAKPYHYGLLIRRIEELLDNSRESVSCRRSSSSAESIRGVGLN